MTSSERSNSVTSTQVIRAFVNGEERELSSNTTVADLVALYSASHTGTAVARNGAVVTRSTWNSVVVQAGDHLEILFMAPGG